MLDRNYHKIRNIIRSLREQLSNMVTYLSEDPENEFLCDMLRDIRDGKVQDAIMEKDPETAISYTDTALLKLFSILNAVYSRDNNGMKLPREKAITAGQTVIPFAERMLIIPVALEHSVHTTIKELTHYGAEIPKTLAALALISQPEIEL